MKVVMESSIKSMRSKGRFEGFKVLYIIAFYGLAVLSLGMFS